MTRADLRHLTAPVSALIFYATVYMHERDSICSMSNHVMALIAQKYQKVRGGVEPIMGGKIIEYEAKTILNKGIEQGIR